VDLSALEIVARASPIAGMLAPSVTAADYTGQNVGGLSPADTGLLVNQHRPSHGFERLEKFGTCHPERSEGSLQLFASC